MRDLKRFMISIPDSAEDTSWFVDASSPEAAAELYVSAALDERISVDLEEMEDEGELRVWQLPDISSDPGILDWMGLKEKRLPLESIEIWRTHPGDAGHPEIEP